jgi:toxin FitB
VATFSLDSNCMIAAVCAWHEHHAAVARAIEVRLGRRGQLVAAGHAIVEAYAVLTRLPAPHRLAPADAWTLIKTNFVDQASLAALPAEALVAMLERLARGGVGGGRTYDALIAATVGHVKADELLTLNPRHFDGIAGDVKIVSV